MAEKENTPNHAYLWSADSACLIDEPLPSFFSANLSSAQKSDCVHEYAGICMINSPENSGSSVFGFSEFITALALLVVVYTVTDARYRFRVSIAPIPLFGLTYFLIGLIGFGTLITDLWFAERWLIPDFLSHRALWQSFFGATFLTLVIGWLYYAFIRPPVFGRSNYKKYARELYRYILKGSNTELPAIAGELARSARPLVKLSRQTPSRWRDDTEEANQPERKQKPKVGDYAHDILLLIGSRKLCRHVVASSPVTAMAFFEDMSELKKYEIPIGQFAKNISTESILNKDSLLYHEDEGYSSGLIGYLKPFSQAIYGNHELVERLATNNGSPLDIDYQAVWSWDAVQFEAYKRVVLITFEDYLERDKWWQHSFALYRAMGHIKDSCRDVYKLSDVSDYFSSDIFRRLNIAVDFVKEAVELIGKLPQLPTTTLRVRERDGRIHNKDFYDHIAELMFDIIFDAACVKGSPDLCWSVHYNAVWSDFFTMPKEGKAWSVVHFKLRRLLYEEITWRPGHLNYKSARILGLCLNVMGLKLDKHKSYDRDYFALHKVLLKWTRENYLKIRNNLPDVADACLIGSISFDEENNRLVKTYIKGLNKEAPKEYLDLIIPKPEVVPN